MASAKEVLDDFDPNNQGKTTPWATFCLYRRPEFKVHKQRSTGIAALNYHGSGILYEWENGKWVQRVRKRNDDHHGRCNQCGASTLQQSTLWNGTTRTHDTGKFVWLRRKRKLVEPLTLLYLCKTCAPHFANR